MHDNDNHIILKTDSKEYLLKAMKGEDSSPVKTGKGCRKRTTNAKYLNETDEESDNAVGCCTHCLLYTVSV